MFQVVIANNATSTIDADGTKGRDKIKTPDPFIFPSFIGVVRYLF